VINIPGRPEVNTKDLETEVALLRRRLSALELALAALDARVVALEP
jgi:hypothetical protein